MSTPDENRLNLSAGAFSVTVALALVIAKIWALRETGSLSVAATLADSALDLMMSLGGLAAIIYAAKPADDDHTFGHTSAEDLAALAQSLFILGSAGVIAAVAVSRLLAGDVPLPRQEEKGIAVVVFSIVVTLALVAWQRRVARTTGNKVVAADSLHYIGDLVPNVGAIVALFASARFGLGQVDSVVALGAALFLAVGALRIGKEAWDALMDRAAPPEIITGIEKIAADFPGVHGFHDLKTRRAGSRFFVNMHIELDGAQSLTEAHAIGAALRRAIVAEYPQADVLIHKDPVGVEPHPDDPRHRQ
ncbi:cation diffusion facilitator family transporter [Loktanella sp. IMCC34160]|uniref:cation diffusion facilitator family transporter n=1 Tax=Loktanella sp. IMCC34160 TaxID=2510646 RepID=UPI00101E1CC0|nr:cation diffusion facilitator family transporter [Loktanella sp. IMCC34160]RYG90914.1 cation diffusion facilitator family transporter [Loktanella sp. IMCC34160]